VRPGLLCEEEDDVTKVEAEALRNALADVQMFQEEKEQAALAAAQAQDVYRRKAAAYNDAVRRIEVMARSPSDG